MSSLNYIFAGFACQQCFSCNLRNVKDEFQPMMSNCARPINILNKNTAGEISQSHYRLRNSVLDDNSYKFDQILYIDFKYLVIKFQKSRNIIRLNIFVIQNKFRKGKIIFILFHILRVQNFFTFSAFILIFWFVKTTHYVCYKTCYISLKS